MNGRKEAGMKMNLLIVDDDPTVLDLFAAALGGDFTVECARGGEAGLEACLRGGHDVVLLDLFMPRVDGLKFLGRIRMEAGTRDLPVVVFSSSRVDGRVRLALAENPSVRGVMDKVSDFRRFAPALLAAAAS